MLRIQRNQPLQSVVVSLREALTGENLIPSNYLLTLRTESRPDTIVSSVVLPITADYGVWQRGELATDNNDPLAGEFIPPVNGFYLYYIYAQASPNLTPQAGDILCEQGRIEIYG
jgi:hypothetical protein